MGIKEDLKSKLGDAWTDEVDAEFGKALGAAFVPKNVHAEALEKVKGLETQVSTTGKQLDDLRKAAEGSKDLQTQIDTYKTENETLKEAHAAELSGLKFGYALDVKLSAAGAKSPKAVKAFLDTEKLKLDGDNIIGLDDQLKTIRESESYLFDETKTEVPGGGGNPPPADKDKKPRPTGTVIL
jgi:hypothetical protein